MIPMGIAGFIAQEVIMDYDKTAVGDRFVLIEDNPFLPENIVQVIEKKKGWLRFKYVHGPLSPSGDEYAPMEYFFKAFERITT